MKLAQFGAIRRTLGHRDYGLYSAGNSVSLVGNWIQRVAVGWLAWELTSSGAWLGLLAMADLSPALILGPLGGAVADRGGRLRLIQIAQAVSMATSLVLVALIMTELVTPELLFLLVLVSGAAQGFIQPARLSLVPSLVPREDISTAVAINAIIFNLARFIGPAIAGLLIVSADVAAAFAVNSVSFLAFMLVLSRIRLREDALPTEKADDASLLADIGEGLAYTARHPGIGPLLLLSVCMSFGVRPYVELLPGFASAVFGKGADGLAALTSTIGAGAILSGFWLAGRGGREGLGRLTLVAMGVLVLSVIGFAATTDYTVALVLMGISGLAMVVGGVGAQTLIQLSVQPEMRARVMSLYGLIFRGGPAAGALAMGAASEVVGLRWPLAVGGLATLVVWLAIWWRKREPISDLEGRGQTRESPSPRPAATLATPERDDSTTNGDKT